MNSYSVIIDRFEDSFAVLRYNSQDIIIPIDMMPEGAYEGMVLEMSLGGQLKQASIEQNQNNKAKDILNEILNSSSNNTLND